MTRLTRIFQDCDIATHARLQLDDAATTHVARVLRMRPGQSLILFNGRGGEYLAQLEKVEKRLVSVFVEQFDEVDRESRLAIHLGQALVRGERMDYAIQKAVEIGVSDIHPLNTSYSGVQISDERIESRYKHWRQIIISACEQSGRTRLPLLHDLVNFEDYVTRCQSDAQGWILQAGNYVKPSVDLNQAQYLCIGPEGGFSEQELHFAAQHGFTALSLGPRIFRTETAGVVAAAHLQCLAGVMD